MSVITQEASWHEGEDKMHMLLKVPYQANPNTPFLTPQRAYMLQAVPLVAVGSLDKEGRPWATIWGGEAGFAQQIAPSIVGFRTTVDSKYDPVADILFGGRTDGEIVKEQGKGKMVTALGIDLESRSRVKLFGHMLAGALGAKDESKDSTGEVQLVVKIEESLGNCPKYLNCKQISPSIPEPTLISDAKKLSAEALDLVSNTDMFFMSTSNRDIDMDCNHRGGPPGFIRVASNGEAGAVLIWPEYSGNRLYQSLGNLQVSPRAGLVIPDFESGDVLYISGETEILVGLDAEAVLPRSNLAVRLTITSSRFVQNGLPFRGTSKERSPYNPSVRYLPTERPDPAKSVSQSSSTLTAKLITKRKITASINRYRFALSSPPSNPIKPGQYVALSFRDELDVGYSHMRDDDPLSINDDFIRTFTVSSAPGLGRHGEEFEITVRRVGSITTWLSMQNERSGLELFVVGFGGSFNVSTDDSDENDPVHETIIPFIAGGIGITPLLPALSDSKLNISKLRLLWSLSIKDIDLVSDVFKSRADLANVTTLFITGLEDDGDAARNEVLRSLQATIGTTATTTPSNLTLYARKLQQNDLSSISVNRWYLCTSPNMRKDVLPWLEGDGKEKGKEVQVIYEDFGY